VPELGTGGGTTKSHFDSRLNIRNLMFEKRPKLVVECGAGNGECTVLLAHMLDNYPFELHAISDKKVEGLDPRIVWKIGLSYEVLKNYPDGSIGMCLIDTDHNYWTLAKELEAVKDKMEEGGLIIFHDVDEFYHNNGMAMSYWNDQPYPADEIKACVQHGGIGDALLKFLVQFNDQYKLLYWTRESYGAACIEKKTVKETHIITPGDKPVFAKPYDGNQKVQVIA
jgi:methyltransferase family protein